MKFLYGNKAFFGRMVKVLITLSICSVLFMPEFIKSDLLIRSPKELKSQFISKEIFIYNNLYPY